MARHRLQPTRYTRPRRRRAGLLVAILAVIGLLLTGCANSDKATQLSRDTERAIALQIAAPTVALTMPDKGCPK